MPRCSGSLLLSELLPLLANRGMLFPITPGAAGGASGERVLARRRQILGDGGDGHGRGPAANGEAELMGTRSTPPPVSWLSRRGTSFLFVI